MCSNRFKKGIYCKNTRINKIYIDNLINQFVKMYVKKNHHIRYVCKNVCIETGNSDLVSEIEKYQEFEYCDIEDISIIIPKYVVFPDNKINAIFIDGTEIMLVWDKNNNVVDNKVIKHKTVNNNNVKSNNVNKNKDKDETVNIKSENSKIVKEYIYDGNSNLCKNCGKPVIQSVGRKKKKFCCDKCRIQYWHKQNEYNAAVPEEYICEHCGKTFLAPKSSPKKYCCHECYIHDRFYKKK